MTLLLAPWSEYKIIDEMIRGEPLSQEAIEIIENQPDGSRCNVAIMTDLEIKDPHIILSSYLSGLEYRPMLTALINGIIFGSVHAMSGGGNDINQLMYGFVKWAYEKALMHFEILNGKAKDHLNMAGNLIRNAHSNDHENVDWQWHAQQGFNMLQHFLPKDSIETHYSMVDRYESALEAGMFPAAHGLRTAIVTHLNISHNVVIKPYLEEVSVFNNIINSTASWYIAGDWNSSIHELKNEHFVKSKEETVALGIKSTETDSFKKILFEVIKNLHMLRLDNPTHNGGGELDYVLTNSSHPWQPLILINKSLDVSDPSIKTSDHAALIFEFK